jgi:hypothetical protein
MQPREAHELKGLADIVEQSKQKLFSSKFTERFKVKKTRLHCMPKQLKRICTSFLDC